MKILIVDCETTISNKGQFADSNNKLVMSLAKWNDGDFVEITQEVLDEANLVVGFNIKFDLHWLRNTGFNISRIRIWDCQIAEYLLENQLNPYNSLNGACNKYGLETKLDVVKTEYWDKGVDTDNIPKDILLEYLKKDIDLTHQVFIKQVDEFKKAHSNLLKLFKLQCRDLLVLEEMEYNGIRFNTKLAREEAETLDEKITGIYNTVSDICNNIPINLSSNDHVSALLYGGTITETIKQPDGVFKSGARKGQIKYKNVDIIHELPRLIDPLNRTETSKSKKFREEGKTDKETLWDVNADVIGQLEKRAKGNAKKVIQLLNEHSKLEKLKGTYLIGWSDLIDKMNWKKDMIYGNLNQCVAVTGRLSSTKPNLQNVDPATKKYIETRYAD